MESSRVLGEKDWLACCGSTKFAQEMVLAGPFSDFEEALDAAKDIWFNDVDVNGWLEAFAAHPQIGASPLKTHKSPASAQWSKGEQYTALATATDSTLQELQEWNARYMEKFGFVFLIFASGRSTPEILAELKRRYHNRPIVEFENAAQEQMKITELRLSKLFSANPTTTMTRHTKDVKKAGEDRMNIIRGHLSSQSLTMMRPPITTHILDVARGTPAAGVEVHLEMWENDSLPLFGQTDSVHWKLQGSSTTDNDGRSGQLMDIVDALNPGMYRISFNTGKYNPNGFFPYVSIAFEAIKEKLNDMSAMRKAKAEAKEEEKAEKELARARVEVAHEVRMAREAEAAMDLHVQKAADKVTDHERKHGPLGPTGAAGTGDLYDQDSYSRNAAGSPPPGYSAEPMYGSGPAAASGHDTANYDSASSTAGTTYSDARSGGPPSLL